ncbi:hypothetical protein E1A91_A06G006800v1 [Gossypium mustelinum]|uniref:Phytosulfokine-beta n=1 Tax=Gossypium mustelinum TaxID=34275 RepID=A0A5D2YRL8_GOSMU|nr:hypothetical protein E1A91_A06G006800v1 [Gossypium mustelinum]
MISMENKSSNIRFMLLFLGLCCFLILCVAVPTTRNLKLNEELLPSSLQNLLPQDVKKSNEAKEMSGLEFNEERMLIETIDYAETGSNTKHDALAPPPLI